MSNDRVCEWLEGLGYVPEPEPSWITQGQRPDFFCPGERPVWVEVKILKFSRESELFDRAWNVLCRRADKIRGMGEGHILVGQTFDDKAAAQLIKCLGRELGRQSRASVRIVAVPVDPEVGRWARLSYSLPDGSLVEQVGPAALSGSYPSYPSCEPHWSKPATLALSDGTTMQVPAFRLLNVAAGKVALRLFDSETPFKISSASLYEATRNRSRERVREAIDEANDQIRNGQLYKTAPGIACIYQESMEALGGRTLLSALFGDLTVPIDRHSRKFGEAFFGRNGILSPDKNRGVSAVRYTGHGGKTTFVVNPWAAHSLKWEIFAEEAYLMWDSKVQRIARATK